VSSRSEASSRVSAGSISASNEQATCELCGSASRTSSAGGSLLGIGRVSRAIPTCAPWWPTPHGFPKAEYARRQGPTGNELGRAINQAARGERCPCRCHTSAAAELTLPAAGSASGPRSTTPSEGQDSMSGSPTSVKATSVDPSPEHGHPSTLDPSSSHGSTSSSAASPAKTSPTPAKAQGSTGNARVFGASTPDSFANYDPATSSWKTSQLSLLEDSGEFSGTWPRAGMTRSGTAFRLVPLAPLTGGTASGLWRTPTAYDGMQRHNAVSTRNRVASGKTISLGMQIHAPETWPTPRARDWKGPGYEDDLPSTVARQTWPTPTKSDGEGGPGNSGRQGGENLRTAAGGQLNPTWVEWLMGFPIGFTDLGASGTRSCRRSRRSSAGGSSNGKA
jgi:hypothetical protein